MNEAGQVEAIDRVQAYIEAHLQEKISLNDLARVAHHSPAYTARLFKKIVGITAFDYIRNRRLSCAALKLRDSDNLVLDVALDFVFDSHEGFTRAFTQRFGLPPKQYSLHPQPIRLFMPYSVKQQYLSRLKRKPAMNQITQNIFTQVIQKPERTMLICRGKKATHYFEYCEEVSCDVWGVLTSVKEALSEPVGLWLPEEMRKEGTSEYVQGVDVPNNYSASLPEGFELIKVPAHQVMVFQGSAFEDEDYAEAISSLWDAIEQYDPTLYGYKWAPDSGPRFQMEPQGVRGYIEGRPVVTI